jgi:hypothetical protein
MTRLGKVAALFTVVTLGAAAPSANAGRAAQGGVFTKSPAAGATVSGSIVWEAGFSGATPARVDFLIDGVLRGSDSAAPFVYGGQNGTLDTTSLANGTRTFKVTAYSGKKTYSSSIQVTVANDLPSSPKPPPPSQVTATPLDFAHVAVSWGSVSGAVSYAVYRDGRQVARIAGNTFTDSMLWPATVYNYSVTAVSATGSTLATLGTSPAATGLLPASGYPRPFPANSVWNTPVGDAQPVPNSAALVSYLVANMFVPNMTLRSWGVGVAEAKPGDPIFSVPCLIYPLCTLGAFGPFAIPSTAVPDPQGDSHLAVYDPAAHREWDMWQAQATATGWTAGAGAAVSMDGNGVAPAGTPGADAANLPLLGGLVRPEEILQGRIDHALAFTMPNVSKLGHVCPATHHDGSTTDPNALREGMRLQLDPAVNVDALPMPAWEKTVVRAMQTYGMYLRDQGGTLAIFAETPASRGYDAWAKVGLPTGNSIHLDGIPWDRFRVITAPC